MKSMVIFILAGALVAAMCAVGLRAEEAVAEKAPAQEIKTVVPGRMVCCEKCRGVLDLANGIKPCPGCDGVCNVAHKYCTKCAKRLGVCEVCSKKMGSGVKPVKATEADVKAVVAGNNGFACDLYRKLAETDKGNLFFSPYSTSTALAMTYAGAEGQTEAQMAKTLRFGLAEATLHDAFRQIVDDFNAAGGAEKGKRPYDLTVANAVWVQQGYGVLGSFMDVVTDSYAAQACQADFAKDAEAARKVINTWVEEKTREKIKDLIGPGVLNDLTRMVLTNAIYFKGQWDTEFDKKLTRPAAFMPAASKDFRGRVAAVQVPLMNQTAKFGYLETERMQALELPYKGGELSMLVLLPKSAPLERSGARYHTEDLVALEQSLTPENLAAWTKNLKEQKVRVALPRFKATLAFNLNDVLQSMGMTDAFDSVKADFSGMTGKKDLFIAAVLHKAFVDVNEEGTEAAAATAVVLELKGMPEPPPVFRADHPFVFLIRHKPTGQVLFMGRVMDPTK